MKSVFGRRAFALRLFRREGGSPARRRELVLAALVIALGLVYEADILMKRSELELSAEGPTSTVAAARPPPLSWRDQVADLPPPPPQAEPGPVKRPPSELPVFEMVRPTPLPPPVKHKREPLPPPLDGAESYGPKLKKHAYVHPAP